jgi:outer membrane receptor protein involved in Fe transport
MSQFVGIIRGAVAATVSSLVFVSAAGAQDSQPTTSAGEDFGSPVLEEVIVSATRRDLPLQDIGASIGVITSADIENWGMDDFHGYSRTQPGVIMHQAVKNRSTFNIRGINTDIGDTQLTQEPVAVYINDMPVTQPYAALVQVDLRLYDIERIEVIRGPQGTLYGSGTLGGLVRVLTRQPVLGEFEASVQVDWAGVKHAGWRQRYDAMVNVPLSDNVAMRAVAYLRDEPGWVKNEYLGTENSNDDWGGRVALLWEANDRFSTKFEFIHQDSDPEDGDAWNPDVGKFRRNAIITEERKAVFSQANATLIYDFQDFATLTSSTNFQKTNSNWLLQSGEIPGIGILLNETSPYDTDYFAQELRLVSNTGDDFDWVAGLFYLDSETKDAGFRFVLDGLQDFVESILGPGAIESDDFFTGDVNTSTREVAAYGDLTWHVNDEWSLSGGLRVFETKSRYWDFGSETFDFECLCMISLPAVDNENTDSDWTWRAVASYTPEDDRHYYVNISKGYRVGQVNPNFGPSFVDPEDVVIPAFYFPDESINYEIGSKLRFADGRYLLNLAAYYIDWTDVQADAVRQSDQRNFIANAGDAESKGLEIELMGTPTDNLDFRVALSWQDSKIDSISDENSFLSGAVEGDTMPGTADFLAAASLGYRWGLASARSLEGRVGMQYVDDSPNRFSNAPATGMPNPDFAINESYTNVDAGLSLIDDRWVATLYVENLTNNDNIILDTGAVATGSGDNHYLTLRPRTIGVRLNYFF